ncbi:wd repeat protein [Venturia nashicola]|uniref:Wd repeat protein n=1 Tax=Venturia nashicola TaxID=86259 RepID=A0A4Z1PD61_9PEZI|nr:wd repeat protein [Venturia nashicola]TLD39221.1 wd repeat protein [Venturia nashicola]
MATVLPPPSKRQKREALEKSSIQAVPETIPEGSVRVNFVDRATGESTGPSISVPLSQASVKNLELLLNSLQGNTEAQDRIPYRFFHERKKGTPEEQEQALAENGDIYSGLVKPGIVSTEEELVLSYSPQAVFRVKAVSRCASSINGHGEPILTAQFSPATSSLFVTGSGDSTARIWDTDTSTPKHTLSGHTSWVLCVCWSPCGSMIATGSNDRTVRVFGSDGKPLGGAMKGHTAFVRALCWEPYHLQETGRPRLASASKDATVRIWDVISRTADIVLSGHKASVSCVRWGGTGNIYTSSQDKTIKIWDGKKGTLIHTLTSHGHWVNHICLSTDYALRTGFWDHKGKKPASEEERIEKAKKSFEKAATLNGKLTEHLVSASDDNVLMLWDPFGPSPTKPVAKLLGHQKQVNFVTFSPDGLYIASCSFDNSVKLWNARDGKFILTFRGHVAPVYQCAFSADSRLLVSSSKDTTLKAWDVRTGKIANDLPGHADEVYAVDWSVDGLKVGSGGKDRAVRLWTN